jgi:hypothetical protein
VITDLAGQLKTAKDNVAAFTGTGPGNANPDLQAQLDQANARIADLQQTTQINATGAAGVQGLHRRRHRPGSDRPDAAPRRPRDAARDRGRRDRRDQLPAVAHPAEGGARRMSDILRVVTLSAGGRPITAQDLENGSTFLKAAKTFQIAPGQRKPQMAGPARRYAGQRAIGENQDNGIVQWTALVSGANVANQTCANADAMLAVFENWAPGMLLEFRPDGASRSTFFDVRGAASWVPHYEWAQFAGARSITVDIQVPVAPLALLAPCDILDDFSVDSVGGGDWTFDAGVSTDVAVSGGVLTPAGVFTTERRMTHTARGYSELEAQGTTKATPGATITSFKAGGHLRRSAANTYVDVYVDDNGTNSRLQIDVVIAGVRTNRSLTNLAARVVTGTPFWVRRRIEGNTVFAEYFTAAPTRWRRRRSQRPTRSRQGRSPRWSPAAPGSRGSRRPPARRSTTTSTCRAPTATSRSRYCSQWPMRCPVRPPP